MLSAPIRVLDRTYTVYGLEGDRQFAAIAKAGRWDEFPLEHLRHLVRPGSLVVDVGAYAGLFSLACAQLGAGVIALEGSPNQTKALSATVSYHAVTAVNAVVGDGSPVSWVDDELDRTSSHANPNPLLPEKASLRLDALLADATPALIKIDAEGSEPEILDGAEKTLARCQPIVLCEFNSFAALAWRKTLPEQFLASITHRFPYVHYFKNRRGDLRPLKGPEPGPRVDDFLAYNYTHGLVDDLLCAYAPVSLPPLPAHVTRPSRRQRVRQVLGRAATAIGLA